MSAGAIRRALWRHKLVACAMFLVVLAAGYATVKIQGRHYQSGTDIILAPKQGANTTPIYIQAGQTLLLTEAQLIKAPSFLSHVASQLKKSPTTPTAIKLPTTLDSKVATSVQAECAHLGHSYPISVTKLESAANAATVPNQVAVKVKAQSGSAKHANWIAQALACNLFSAVAKNASNVYTPEVFQTPKMPTKPLGASTRSVLAAFALVGIAFALGAALLWERIFDRVAEADLVSRAIGFPVIGVVPDMRSPKDGRSLLFDTKGTDAFTESFRAMRANVLLARSASGTLDSVAILGLRDGDGASTVAANLAAGVAEAGVRAILVDADTEAPAQSALFGIPNELGLSNANGTAAEVQATSTPGLSVVAAGPPPPTHRDLAVLYQRGVDRYKRPDGIVLIDCPPLDEVADVRLLAARAGAVLVVVRSRSMSTRALRRALDGLEAVGVPVLGVVLTKAGRATSKRWRSGYSAIPLDPAASAVLEPGHVATS